MRFRPFGITGTAVSAVSLGLTDTAGRPRVTDWVALIYLALENGINSFEIIGHDPAIIEALAVALQAVERRLVFIGLRLGAGGVRTGRDFSPGAITRTIEAVCARTAIGHLDLAMLDDPATDELSPETLNALKDMRKAGRTRLLGVAGHDEAIDAYILTEAFDVLATPYNLLSGWQERHRLKASQERDMAVIGYDYYPKEIVDCLSAKPAGEKGGWFSGPAKHNILAGAGTYSFLKETPGWTPEQICLAYALTEPALATVQVTADAAARLADLAGVADRDLPAGAGSRVEMARFGTQQPSSANRAKA